MSDGILQIKSMYMEALYEAQHWQERALKAESELQSFWSGQMPDGGGLSHLILSNWGKKRNQQLANRPALLQGTLPE